MILEKYFSKFRKNIVGINYVFKTPFGNKKLIYTDWTASGRLYGPIEDKIKNEFGPLIGNTHTETTLTGTAMTRAYHLAKKNIKKHAGAESKDIMLSAGSGMTGAIVKLQRILGLIVPEKISQYTKISESLRPVVFITHMEHHSNQTSWLETIADVKIINPTEEGLVNLTHLKELLNKYKKRKYKIASVTAGSNVTGIASPYYEIAKIMHQNNGLCFVDFACAAPYVNINMHPKNPLEKLDAIFLSPHKFLGGPGTSGVLIFDSKLYTNKIPDRPGGGTVTWTNPWGEHQYYKDIELREDGGTPPFLQTIRTALAIKLKEQMGVSEIFDREKEILKILFDGLEKIKGLKILAGNIKHRLGVISFTIDNLHYNLIAKLLNDHYGIQTRGGCACAGTYGHYLFNISKKYSKEITHQIDLGDLSVKPGFVRLSLHPTTTNAELKVIIRALVEISKNGKTWQKEYIYNNKTNEWIHKKRDKSVEKSVQKLMNLEYN